MGQDFTTRWVCAVLGAQSLTMKGVVWCTVHVGVVQYIDYTVFVGMIRYIIL